MEREPKPQFIVMCDIHGYIGTGIGLDDADLIASDHMYSHEGCGPYVDDVGATHLHVHIERRQNVH